MEYWYRKEEVTRQTCYKVRESYLKCIHVDINVASFTDALFLKHQVNKVFYHYFYKGHYKHWFF